MSDPSPLPLLCRDVSTLGRILGQTLVEQEGAALFDLEEEIRAMAKARCRAAPASPEGRGDRGDPRR